MGIGVIMAGGFGKRLWPESGVSYPKQFMKIKNRESFIQQTYRRCSRLFGASNTLFVTRSELKEQILRDIPEISPDKILTEPVGRDTAPCIGFAAVWIEKKLGNLPMAVLPSDHLIEDDEKFNLIIEAAIHQAEKDYLVTIGIKPTRIETGYGYIEVGEKITEYKKIPLYNLKRFTEKPSHKKAKEFVESGNFLWNAGIFAWRPSVILQEIKKYLPPLYKGLLKIRESLDTPEEKKVLEEVYPQLPKISIDYAVMEKTKRAVVIPADFYWDDVGDWHAVERIFPKDENGNIIKGLVKEIKTKNCTLINREDKIMGIIGLSEVIVVNSEKGLLVVSKELSQEVKGLVDSLLQDEKMKKYLE